jgi:SAM-dependent methyltransferase
MRRRVAIECAVCEECSDHVLLYEKWGYPIQRCLACGVGSTGNASVVKAEALYDESYFQGGQRDGYADYVGSENVLRVEFRRALAHLKERGCSGGRLLEIGCAYGYFLMEARKDFECTGLEISPAALAACRSSGLAVFSPNEPEGLAIWSRKGSFDAVVMLDCIEHLPDPSRTIERIAGVLAPGGFLLVTTGDWESWVARLMGKRWRLMTPPQHLHFFSPRTLGALLDRHGMEVVDCVKPWKFVPLGLAAYQMGNRFGLRSRFLERVNTFGVSVNLFDTFRLLGRKPK